MRTLHPNSEAMIAIIQAAPTNSHGQPRRICICWRDGTGSSADIDVPSLAHSRENIGLRAGSNSSPTRSEMASTRACPLVSSLRLAHDGATEGLGLGDSYKRSSEHIDQDVLQIAIGCPRRTARIVNSPFIDQAT